MGEKLFDFGGKHYSLSIVQDVDLENPTQEDGQLLHYRCLGRSDFPKWNEEITQEEYSKAEKEFIKTHRNQDYYNSIDMDAVRNEIVRIIRKHLEEDAKAKGDEVACFPLYGYSHSGVTIALHDFPEGGGFDNFVLGFVYYRRSEVEKAGAVWNAVVEGVKDEVGEYAAYLQGDVYGYELEEVDEDGEEVQLVDSCWGFIDNQENPQYRAVVGMAENLDGQIEGMEKEELIKKLEEAYEN